MGPIRKCGHCQEARLGWTGQLQVREGSAANPSAEPGRAEEAASHVQVGVTGAENKVWGGTGLSEVLTWDRLRAQLAEAVP